MLESRLACRSLEGNTRIYEGVSVAESETVTLPVGLTEAVTEGMEVKVPAEVKVGLTEVVIEVEEEKVPAGVTVGLTEAVTEGEEVKVPAEVKVELTEVVTEGEEVKVPDEVIVGLTDWTPPIPVLSDLSFLVSE